MVRERRRREKRGLKRGEEEGRGEEVRRGRRLWRGAWVDSNCVRVFLSVGWNLFYVEGYIISKNNAFY